MKIVLIRHAKVDMLWEKSYNSVNFDLACRRYAMNNILPVAKKLSIENQKNMIYISDLSRTFETAFQLFNRTDFYKTELFNEVPLKSFIDTVNLFPLFVWNVIGRLQWLFNNHRQEETIKQTTLRANTAIKLLEEKENDCFVVTHGLFIRTLIKQLKGKGYKIIKARKFGISNLESITAYK